MDVLLQFAIESMLTSLTVLSGLIAGLSLLMWLVISTYQFLSDL